MRDVNQSLYNWYALTIKKMIQAEFEQISFKQGFLKINSTF